MNGDDVWFFCKVFYWDLNHYGTFFFLDYEKQKVWVCTCSCAGILSVRVVTAGGRSRGPIWPLQGSCTQRGAGRSPLAHNLAVLLLYSCIHTAVSPLYPMHTLIGRRLFDSGCSYVSMCVSCMGAELMSIVQYSTLLKKSTVDNEST